jgi:YaiO family outer membrane protein
MVLLSALMLASTLPAEPADARVRLDASMSHSTLSDGLPDWREVSFAVSRNFADGWTAAVRAEALQRFGAEDVYMEARADHKVGETVVHVAAGGTPDADFRPEWALKASIDAAVGRAATGLCLLADADVSRFATGAVFAARLGFAFRPAENRLGWSMQAVAVSEPGGPTHLGYTMQAQAPVARGVVARIGYADAPETSVGVVTRVRGVNGGILFDISDRWLVRADGGREDRGAYLRTEVSLGVARRF